MQDVGYGIVVRGAGSWCGMQELNFEPETLNFVT